MLTTIIVILFILGYLLIALEHPTGINKAATALLLGAVCWTLNLVAVFPDDAPVLAQMNEHLANISQIIIFLLGAMTIVELIDSHHGFKIILRLIRTDDKRVLLWIIAVVTFFTSAVLDNLTTSIIMVTLLRRLIKNKNERLLFAAMVVIAANAGGAWTPIGDVTTTMLWIRERISAGGVIREVFLPSVVSMILPLIYFSLCCVKGKLTTSTAVDDAPAMYGAKRVFFLGVGTLISVPILKSLTGLPPYMGIMLGVGLMWTLTDLIHQERHFLKVPHILTRVDVSSILFFLGILLAVAALQTAGLLSAMADWLALHLKNQDGIIAILGVISSIVDNVPLTAAIMGMYHLHVYPIDAKLWEMTAYCIGTGGSLLIIGSAAGVVVMGMEKIRFGWYLRRIGLPALLGYGAGAVTFLVTHNWWV